MPKLRGLMVEAGFRFRDDGGVLTTAEMAERLGISETHLRWLERKGVVPPPKRDTVNRRKWLKADLPKLRRLLAKFARGAGSRTRSGRAKRGIGTSSA